jgi:CheY-like chemotaxis protein
VVEDEALIAAMIADILYELEASVVGPVGSIAAGLPFAEAADIDVAVLDVNVQGEPIDSIASLLRFRQIPFVFTTGYGSQPRAGFEDVPVIGKPYSDEKLTAALAVALASKRPGLKGPTLIGAEPAMTLAPPRTPARGAAFSASATSQCAG